MRNLRGNRGRLKIFNEIRCIERQIGQDRSKCRKGLNYRGLRSDKSLSDASAKPYNPPFDLQIVILEARLRGVVGVIALDD